MSDTHELEARIDAYLAEGRVLHLATVSNGIPWMCHVWYAIGPHKNSVVFTSNTARRHSNEIRACPNVAGGVVAIPLDGLGQRVQGLSFEGQALETTGDGILAAYEAYALRWPRIRDMFSAREIESGASAMRIYVIRMSRIVLFDEVNYPAQPRQELLIPTE